MKKPLIILALALMMLSSIEAKPDDAKIDVIITLRFENMTREEWASLFWCHIWQMFGAEAPAAFTVWTNEVGSNDWPLIIEYDEEIKPSTPNQGMP